MDSSDDHFCSHCIYTGVCTGVWSCPVTTGDTPPPCSGFTFTAVDDRRAVLFGGYNVEEGKMNSVYIIDLLTMVNYFHRGVKGACPHLFNYS